MDKNRRAVAIGVAMCATSATAFALRPGPVDPSRPPSIVLRTAIQERFGDLSTVVEPVQVLNPQVQAIIDDIYGEVLSRRYVTKDGYVVMLSVAYGKDQRDGLTAHKPEVCYPAQGFALAGIDDGTLGTPLGTLKVTRLKTSLGPRQEPVTYWFTQGDQVVKTRVDRRIAQIKAAVTGQLPDGILFRVSSIDRVPENAFARQQGFVADLVTFLKPKDLKTLTGLNLPATA
jgi:EpsI family protein